MSEMQNLKEEADKQKAVQKIESLHKYVDMLTMRLGEQSKAVHESMRLGLSSMVLLLVVGIASFFISDPWMLAAMFGSIALNGVLLSRTQGEIHRAQRTMSEIDGVFNTLEILGYLEGGWRNRAKKKAPESKLEKAWAKAKTVKQWRPYGQPAATAV
jgi:hypothetical protein